MLTRVSLEEYVKMHDLTIQCAHGLKAGRVPASFWYVSGWPKPRLHQISDYITEREFSLDEALLAWAKKAGVEPPWWIKSHA